MLGTDVLQQGVLHVDYSKRLMSFNVTAKNIELGTSTSFWVQQRNRAGQPIGPAFMVAPRMNDLDALKDAIKAQAPATVTCDAFAIDIHAPGSCEVAKPNLVLAAGSDAEKPYYFILPDEQPQMK